MSINLGQDVARPSTKSGFVYSRIREAILSGTLLPDQRLRLNDLASQFQLSPMPVREALRMLQRDGLITIEDHRGATVANLSWRRAAEFVEVRTLLEVHAGLLALPRHGQQSLLDLRNLLARMKLPEVMAESDQFSLLNRQFHTALYAPGPNSVLKQEIEDLWDQVWRVRRLSIFKVDPTRASGANQEHESIIAATEAGDLRALGRAMNRHRDQTLRTWTKIVARFEPDEERKDAE